MLRSPRDLSFLLQQGQGLLQGEASGTEPSGAPQEIHPRTQPAGQEPGPTISKQGRHGNISWSQPNRSPDKLMVMRQVQG